MDTDNNNGKAAVEKWLKTGGYPLEMYVAKAFLDYRFAVRQGWNFIDPEEGKPRELDVLAFVKVGSTRPIMLQVFVECKSSKEPFVVFTYPPRESSHLTRYDYHGDQLAMEYFHKFVKSGEINRMSIFQSFNPRTGYSFKQAHKDGKDLTLEVLTKVSKAIFVESTRFKKEAESWVMSGNPKGEENVAHIFIPLIVIDSPLFECYLDQNNDIQIEAVSNSIIQWNYPLVGTLMVRVYTKDSMQKFVSDTATTYVVLDSPMI